MSPEFYIQFNRIKKMFASLTHDGHFMITAPQLQMICQGFFIIGKKEANEEFIKTLKEKL